MRHGWLNLGASFHMTLHKEWLHEYERYDGGDFFRGDDSTTKIIGWWKFKLKIMYGRIITLLVCSEHPRIGQKFDFCYQNG
jgi:hypothetical protein